MKIHLTFSRQSVARANITFSLLLGFQRERHTTRVQDGNFVSSVLSLQGNKNDAVSDKTIEFQAHRFSKQLTTAQGTSSNHCKSNVII